ncbi:hypothetical protein Scep_001240 [Stephania cephalantha]|uniref:Uncharacterized protein n=1 Tax=Stephania cephalantha TaxID=152367 RepID=A0AAP0LBN4_9MAGN
MASSSATTLSSPKLHFHTKHSRHSQTLSLHFRLHISPRTLRAARRLSNDYSQVASGGSEGLIASPRNWSGRNIGGFVDEEEDDKDDDDDESDDRSLDLLVRFLQNVFKKVSRRARKAVRSVLPVSIPTKLVGFSVNGVIILTFLWVLKAFLEVVCTLGSVVFVSILLIRGVWSGVTYMQESRNQRASLFDDEHSAWRGAQPAG